MRKDFKMTFVRARPPCDALLAPWCCVMPQGDVIPVDNFVLAAESKPLVKLADSAMRFTSKESETSSAFSVAERNVCALIRSDDASDASGRDKSQRPGGPAKLRRCADSWVEKLGLSAVSNDGVGNCMFEALGQALAKAGKTPTDARTARTAVVANMMVLEENVKLVFWTDGAGETCTWRRYCTGMRKDGVWDGCKELLAAAEHWNLRIVVVRLGQATVLVGKGERIV